MLGHAPRGACELKFLPEPEPPPTTSHAPRGACELKSRFKFEAVGRLCHAPRGACELKYSRRAPCNTAQASRPARGV